MPEQTSVSIESELKRIFRPSGRRDFLRASGAGGLALLLPAVLAQCTTDSAKLAGPGPKLNQELGDHDRQADQEGVTLDFSDDFGVLNYAYALEQLEAAFYIQVIATPSPAYSARELTLLRDVRDHEIVHRDFFKAALGPNAIGTLTPDFSSINFRDRAQVLTIAQIFEDLGVAAYNGAAKLIQHVVYLAVAGKIVSVEARHAGAIRDLIHPRSRYFAGDDVINEQGLDRAFDPPQVLAAADPFIVNPITVIGLGGH